MMTIEIEWCYIKQSKTKDLYEDFIFYVFYVAESLCVLCFILKCKEIFKNTKYRNFNS